MTTAAVVSIVGILVAAFGSYAAAARRLSGKINTSDATELWNAATQLREEYKAEIGELRVTIRSLRQRVTEIEHTNDGLHEENVRLKRQVEILEAENKQLKERVRELEHHNGRS